MITHLTQGEQPTIIRPRHSYEHQTHPTSFDHCFGHIYGEIIDKRRH